MTAVRVMNNYLKLWAGNYSSRLEKHMRNVFDVRKFSQPMQISGADDGSQQVAQEPRSAVQIVRLLWEGFEPGIFAKYCFEA